MRFALLAVALVACTGRFKRDTSPEPYSPIPGEIARGKYLVDSVAACGACHTTRPSGSLADAEDPQLYLAGGNALEDEGNFKIYIPNLTGDAETGLGKWTDDQIARAIRDGIDDEGDLLFPAMPFPSYQHMSDADTRAVVEYLRTVPKVRQDRPRFDRDIPFMASMGMKLGFTHHSPAKNVAGPDPQDKVKLGKYITYIAHCDGCHALGGRGAKGEDDSEFMGGSDNPFNTPGIGKVWATNLTPDPEFGIAKFSDAQIKEALRSGIRLDGKLMAFPMSSLTPHLKTMTDEDMDALIVYLRTLKPVHKQVPPRELTPQARQRYGG
jgi:mono/diheme cytochrome c family protein